MNLGLRTLFALAGVALLAAGCNKKDADAPPATGGPGPSAALTGPELFQQHCAKCHSAGGPTASAPRGKMKGPDLAKSAADPEHTADWIAAHIRNPQGHTPESRMPPFESSLSADQIRKLAEYITTLK